MKIAKLRLVVAVLQTVLLLAVARPLLAQDAEPGSGKALTLWVDQKTGQVFTKRARGRVPLVLSGAKLDREGLERQIEQKVEAKTQETIQRNQDAMRAQLSQTEDQNKVLAQQVKEMQPGWKSYLGNYQNKFRIGTLFYGDYALYTHTGFAPQEETQINPPGPGNNLYSSFDISRTYINLFFFPTNDWTFRLTPNIYRMIGASNDKYGRTGAIGSSLDGNLGFRLKYAYLQYSKLLDGIPALKGGTITFGQQANPLVGWEEDLYNYRYVNLTPWNYLSLSSSQTGISFQGPIRLGGSEETYFDYDFGVYTNASFHALEQTNTKQVMGRITAYPFGAIWRFQGLGLTGFYDYGYGNTTPDNAQVPSNLKGGNAHITRTAALLHYTAEQWGLAGEFDYGNNAFSAGNLFSGAGPGDEFGFPTGTNITKGSVAGNTCTAATPCFGPTSFGPFTGLVNALLNNGQSRQIGFDFFGHYHIPGTPLTLFGMFQQFMPNDIVPVDPLDFQRFIVGVSYQYNEYLRFALDSQNVSFYHDQFNFPVSVAKNFNYIPGSSLNGVLLPKVNVISNAVPRDTHAIFGNVEFNY
jgi:hypothetical protein